MQHRSPKNILIPKGRHLAVHEGDFVRKGDPILDGAMVPHDILDVLGVEALADYLITRNSRRLSSARR
jgi:DNA-directed RNA polymerase subunit beta'